MHLWFYGGCDDTTEEKDTELGTARNTEGLKQQ